MKVRVGVIGLGMGRHHLDGYLRLAGVEVAAIADADERLLAAVARERGVARTYADYRRLLERADIDAVSIAVPNALHERLCLDALDAGKHVLCEKPLAMTLAEADRIAAAVRRTGRVFMLGLNNRFRPDTEAVKRLVAAGELGRIYHAKAGWLRRRWVQRDGSWFTRQASSGGGALIDLGVHTLDLALWLSDGGRPVSVVAATYDYLASRRSRPDALVDVEDFASAFVRLAGGSTVHFDVSWVSYIEHPDLIYCDVFGTAGGASIRRTPPEETLRVFQNRQGVELNATPILPPQSPDQTPVQASLTAEVSHFVDRVRDGRRPIASIDDAVALQEALSAVYASARQGREVAITEARALEAAS